MTRAEAVEWTPQIPNCARCGSRHWGEWLTKLDGWAWVGDGCLTPEERAKWCREEEKPRGKVDVPMTGK